MAGGCCNLKVLLVLCVLCLAFFIVSFVLAFKVFPDLVDDRIEKSTRLEGNTDQYDRFEITPFPLKLTTYIWHINNSDAVLAGTEKPVLTEVGPFVYNEYRMKTILKTDTDADTITYLQNEHFTFDEEASLPLDQEVTIVNPALLTIHSVAEVIGETTLPDLIGIPFPIAGAADHCARPTFEKDFGQIIITATAQELLFGGIRFCKNFEADLAAYDETQNLCALVNNITCVESLKRKNVVKDGDDLVFTFLGYKEGTDGVYEVKRGMDNVQELGLIQNWNGAPQTDYWGADTTCSAVKGCDSTIYPPHITSDDSFFIFATDVCRTVEIVYQTEDTYKDVDGLVFGTTKDTFSSQDPNSDCYCINQTKTIDGQYSCYLDGVVDVQNCFLSPILLSFPHFLWANEDYQNGVEGLNPDENLHKTFLLVEPNTGTPLTGMKRIQLNTVLRPIVGVKEIANIRRVVLPLIWVEEGIALSDRYIDILNNTYFDQLHLLDGVKYALIAISAVLTLLALGFSIRKYLANQRGVVHTS